MNALAEVVGELAQTQAQLNEVQIQATQIIAQAVQIISTPKRTVRKTKAIRDAKDRLIGSETIEEPSDA